MKAAAEVSRQEFLSRLAGGVTPSLGERVLTVAAVSTLLLVVLASVLRPIVPWDSWAYHLPFSAWLWDIGDARSLFFTGEHLSARYAGFPLFAEFLQGALWKASGSVATTTLINSVSLAVLVVAIGVVVRGSLPIMVFGSLSFPLLTFQSLSNYIDLFVAAMICLQVLSAWQIERQARLPPPSALGRITTGWSGIFILAAATAGNSKFQTLIVSVAITIFLGVYLLAYRSRLAKGALPRVAVVVILATMLSLATAARNAVAYGNPFYPVQISLPTLGVTLPGREGKYSSHPDYAESFGRMARPIYWLASITEIDWKIRQVPPTYNVDSNGGDNAKRYGPGRTGGLWGPFVGFSCLLLLGLTVLVFRRNPGGLLDNNFIFLLFVFLTILTAFMPQSHELRYYLYWPVLLLLVICVLVGAARLSPATCLQVSLAFMFAFVASQHMVGYSLRPLPVTPTAASALGNAPEIAFARRTGGVCLGAEFSPYQFAYSAVFHGGHYVIEQGVEGCKRYPAYPR